MLHRPSCIAWSSAAALIVAALAPSAAPAAKTEAGRVRDMVTALTLIGTLDTGPTPVVVRGTVTGKKAAKMLAAAREVYDDVGRRFVAPREGATPPVTLCLAATQADYDALTAAFDDTPSPLGFYRPHLRVAVVNLARGVGNLRHELVHPLLGDDFPGIPSWLNEGLGALYGTARPTKARLEPLVNYRLLDLHRALRAGDLPTIVDLVASTGGDVHGVRAPTFYAMARYVMLYLHRRDRLEATYAALRDAAGDVAEQTRILGAEVDDDAFREWAGALRYRP